MELEPLKLVEAQIGLPVHCYMRDGWRVKGQTLEHSPRAGVITAIEPMSGATLANVRIFHDAEDEDTLDLTWLVRVPVFLALDAQQRKSAAKMADAWAEARWSTCQ